MVAAMLTLCLLRHAKSSWDDPELDDFDRPLTKRGTKAAREMGGYLAMHKLKPDVVLCSTAVRTQATLALVLPELGTPPPEVLLAGDLYLAPASDILEAVKGVKGQHGRALVIGHNPGLHTFALSMIGGGDRAAIAKLAMGFPTAALAVIAFDLARWSEVKPASGRLEAFVSPRSLS
jgi:phosphohistidine phosphatase